MKTFPLVATLTIIVAAGAILAENKPMIGKSSLSLAWLTSEGKFPSLDGATGWLNSKPLDSAELRGKVVLVDFWTYSCINWLRTEPYIRAWAEKYKNQGLVVIGVHSPEFAFEKNVDNVRRYAMEMKVDYPIAIDSDYGIWRAFSNNYWPALYLIDAEGRIRHHQYGEGGYERTEAMIQQLLVEAGKSGFDRDPIGIEGTGVEAAADTDTLGTSETYVGYARTVNFASDGGVVEDAPSLYAVPEDLRLNHWALSGRWSIGREATTLIEANGRIAFRFRARDVHLVMGPAARGSTVRYKVRIDGEAPGKNAGLDVAEDGTGTAKEQRLYQLVRQQQPIADRTFEIEFLDPGVEAFSFTFG